MRPRKMWAGVKLAALVASLCALTRAEQRKDEKQTADSVHMRRNTEFGVEFKYTRLSRPGARLDIHLVEPAGEGPQKRTLDYAATKWNSTVCIAFAPDYKDPKLRTMVIRTCAYISSRLCLTFVDITDKMDRNDPNWPINNGCKTNAYILIKNIDLCISGVGAGDGTDPISAGLCSDFYIALHELAHALTSAHVQEAVIAPSYISLLAANILEDKLFAYLPRPFALTKYFDAVSTEMYERDDWQQNGDPTYVCLREDMCRGANDLSSEDIMFLELNERYKCHEYACHNASVDCYPGYYARIDGVCQCACPSRLDAATNCKKFINGPNPRAKWPTPVTVLAGGQDSSCPAGMGPTGWLTFCVSGAGVDDGPVKFPTDGKTTVSLPFCSATSWQSQDFFDWSVGGRFCVVKPKEIPCGGVFNKYDLEFSSSCDVQQNGSIGDVTVSGRRVQVKTCCKDEVGNWMFQLPNDKPFRLFAHYYCPYLRGMRSFNYIPSFLVKDAQAYGGPAIANTYIMSYGFYWDLCYYIPPTYGCSQNISLGISRRSVTVTTPGYPSARDPNRRCFYCFNSAEAAHFRLTFLNFDMHVDDLMLYIRYNQWQENSKVDNKNPPTDLISESNVLCVEFWSGYKSVANTGARLRVETVLPGELCYNHSTRGANYLGNKDISETYEKCLPWKDTLDCYESPYQTLDGLLRFYDGNSCRNPGGKLRQPWCFVFKNGTNCIKRYCDVCNLQQVVDAVTSSVCKKLISSVPDFCTHAIQRYGCAKSCNLMSAPADCPKGYTPYGPRCFNYSPQRKTRAEAEATCRKQGRGGTLFQVRDADDQFFLRQYRYDKGEGGTFISGYLGGPGKSWLYTDTQFQLLFTDWAEDAVTRDEGHNCAVLRDESSIGGGGAWDTVSCQDKGLVLTFACQTDRVQTCGPPTAPSDGVAVEATRPFYYEGDKASIACKAASVDDVPTVIMCKGGSWTKLQTACSTCPPDMSVYGDRCSYFDKNQRTPEEAEAACNAKGRNGTLFRVTSEEDYTYVRQQRRIYQNSPNDHTRISGRCLKAGTWTYTGSDLPVTYTNFSKPAKCKKGSYMYIYREYSSSGSTGVTVSTTSQDNITSICQIDAIETSGEDTYSTCQDALNDNPRFCEADEAKSFCPASCGLGNNPKMCQEPVSTSYIRTSPTASVKAGEWMTFACKAGYFQTGGDTVRACGADGKLLGQEPVCDDNPSSLDVGLSLVIRRLQQLEEGQGVLLDRDGLRVPFSGKITHWYCFTRTKDEITFLVFRKSGSSYTYVGSNTVSCEPELVWGAYVAPADQIAVQKDDVVGVYTAVYDNLFVTNCNKTELPDRSWPLPVATAPDATAIRSAKFNTTLCMRPSAGFRVKK